MWVKRCEAVFWSVALLPGLSCLSGTRRDRRNRPEGPDRRTTGSSILRKNYVGRCFSGCTVAHQEHSPAGCSTRPDFSPVRLRRLLHPPALSLPRQPLRPRTCLIPCKAAANYYFAKGAGMIPTSRVFPIPHFIFKGSLVDLRLRASNKHILIVRVP